MSLDACTILIQLFELICPFSSGRCFRAEGKTHTKFRVGRSYHYIRLWNKFNKNTCWTQQNSELPVFLIFQTVINYRNQKFKSCDTVDSRNPAKQWRYINPGCQQNEIYKYRYTIFNSFVHYRWSPIVSFILSEWKLLLGQQKRYHPSILQESIENTVDGRNPAPPGMHKTL